MTKDGRRIAYVCAAVLTMVLATQTAVAVAAGPVIYQLQTGGTAAVGTATAATQEFISIYNNSNQPVDISNYCVSYSSSSDITKTQLGCLVPPDIKTHIMLSAYSTFTLATNEFVTAKSTFVPDITFTSGISGVSGHIRLLDNAKKEVDRLGYGAAVHPEPITNPPVASVAPAAGKILQRLYVPGSTQILQDTDNNSTDFAQIILGNLAGSNLYEEVVEVDACLNIEGLQTTVPAGYLLDENNECKQDFCANIDGLQLTMPEGHESLDAENCTLIPLENAVLMITELLPNVTGTDTGNEFIEIYNPNTRPINLKNYILQLGPTYSKSYTLPASMSIAPNEFIVLKDSETALTLPNTSADIRLVAPAGNIVSISGTYASPAEDQSWALIDGTWQFTNQPTRGVANLGMAAENEHAVENEEPTSLVPCRQDQERNPGTQRCRLIQLAVANVTPCKTGQMRNPATNRCITIGLSDDGLTDCKPGQERNPETNRCRSIVQAASSLKPCEPGQERNPETNRCRSLAAAAGSLAACPFGQERNPETNRCRKSTIGNVAGIADVKDVRSGPTAANSSRWILVALAVTAALGYAVYEWRHEVMGIMTKIRTNLIK